MLGGRLVKWDRTPEIRLPILISRHIGVKAVKKM